MGRQSEELGELAGELIAEVAMIGIARSGILAYKNHYARTGDRWGAVYQGLLTARRWWIWTFAAIAGFFFTTLMLWSMYWHHYITPRTEWITNFTPNTGS